MLYLIDANNLAGYLGMLGQKNFDIALIASLKTIKSKSEVCLVFDGADYWGDKITDRRLTVIYAGKDRINKTADDKIIEIMKKRDLSDVVLISDDIELKERALVIFDKIKILSCQDFVYKFLSPHPETEDIEFGKEELSATKQKKINKELLEEWTQ